MNILGIAYIGLESPTHKDWEEFGTEVMGFGLAEPGADGTVHLRMDDRRFRIAVHPGEVNRLAYLGWEMRDRPSYEEAIEKLRTSGFAVKEGDLELCEQRGVHSMASFTDPAGYHMELCYGQYFHPRSFSPGRSMNGFVAENTGVGHVVLAVPELTEEIQSFAQDVMGMRWFGHGAMRQGGAFYRPKLNPHSHCIAYVQIPGHHGIHHIGIEVQSVDDVGTAYDIVEERSIPLQVTLGRHTQDPVISFYVYTPSGMVIEYLTEGEEYSDENPFYEVFPEKLSLWGHKFVGDGMPGTVLPIEQAAG